MIKKIKICTIFIFSLLITACVSNSAIVMPFEATFHKYVYILTKNLEEINTESTTEYCSLIENQHFSVVYKDGTLCFYDKSNGLFYDTFGNKFDNMPETGLNISIKEKNGFELKYTDGEYYNSETDSSVNTFTAFKLNDTTIRLLIVTGINEFDIIDKTPIVLTESFVNANPNISEYYSNNEKIKEAVIKQYPLLSERFELTENLYYLSKEIPEEVFSELGLTKNTAREMALALNYDFSQVKMILTTVDITLSDNEIIFDISPNRQFRSELIRDKSFKHNIFEFDLDFVKITESESEKITNAQSKY